MLDQGEMFEEAGNVPATLRRLSDIVAEYDEKEAAIPAAIEAFNQATTDVQMAACVGGEYVGSLFTHGGASVYERTMRANLLQSAWVHVYKGLRLDTIAPASDRSKFEMAFKDPAPFTLDNIRATFEKYLIDPRQQILRGLAEAFCKLDPAFKSHDKMKVGVKGLPKRVILSNVTGYGSYGIERLRDVLNALRVYNGQPHIEWKDLQELLDASRGGTDAEIDGMKLRRFANGNGHLFFGPEALRQVNKGLAEYYGEVLPDCPEATPRKAKSTEVSKDLQFYRTPDAVADELIERAYPADGDRVLEPSCGDGALLKALARFGRKNNRTLRALGVEVDSTRAKAAREAGFAVYDANFLQVEPSPDFDVIVMNPPFYGKHYQQHVEHGLKFLKPCGRLLAILPISAVTDHGYVDPGRGWDKWKDLPPGSFSESGTNINTGIATFFADR